MAILNRQDKPARGIVGTWANMEEDNARTFFAASAFKAGVPVTYASDKTKCEPLADGKQFIGIALRNADTDEDGKFAINTLMGVADMGCVFVEAGGTVAAGDPVYYDPSKGTFFASSAEDYLKLPECEFDEAGAKGEPVAIRIRVTPGNAVITAES